MNKADKLFVECCEEIMENGCDTSDGKVRPVYDDGTPAHTLFISHVCETYDLSKGEFPIITFRPIGFKSAIKEVLWIYQDQTSELSVLKNKHNIHWWGSWESKDRPGTIGQRYGATVKKHNLMDNLLEGLKNEPYSRRHVMNLWQESDFKETDGLKPCAFMTTWVVRGKFLDVTLHQRSNDYLVAGHINKVQYAALLMMVAKHVGLTPGKFTHYVDNVHIYDRHLEQGKEMLNRKPSDKKPMLILDTDKTNFYDFTIDDFKMVDYEPVKPQLQFELGI